MKPTLGRQRGATLLISLIMLVLMTLMAVTSFRLGQGNQQVVGNMQQRNQAVSAAQGAIEATLSMPTFTTTPNIAATTYASVNGSGANDIQVVVTPTCKSTQVIPASSLNYSSTADQPCLVGITQDLGVVGAASTSSLCANTLWDIQSVATDTVTNAQATVNQGVNIRVPVTTTCP